MSRLPTADTAPQRALTAAARVEGVTAFTPFFKAFCNETRAGIIEQLFGGERCVCEIVASLDASQPLISHHLAVLRQTGFVTQRSEGTRVYYSLDWAAFFDRLDAFLDLIDRRRAEGADETPGPTRPADTGVNSVDVAL